MGSFPPRAFIKFDEKIFSHLPESLWCGLSFQAAEVITFTIKKNGWFVKRRLFGESFGINFISITDFYPPGRVTMVR